MKISETEWRELCDEFEKVLASYNGPDREVFIWGFAGGVAGLMGKDGFKKAIVAGVLTTETMKRIAPI
jgi:hypothetical protein